MKQRHLVGIMLGLLFGGLIFVSMMSLEVWAQSYPNKPIEYICHSNAGGSSDGFVRNIALILQTEKIIPVSIVVVNKPGGSGALAFGYAAQKAGNPYYWLNVTGNIVTTPLEKPKVPGYKDFTPLSLLAVDDNAIAVSAESPFKSIKDLIETAQKKPKEIRFGGTSIGSQDHITMYEMQRAGKCEFNFISFTGENETLAALLGGHVDVGCFNPRTVKGQVEAKKMRILGVSSAKRMAALPDIPTLVEMGYQVVTPMGRGIMAPKGIPNDAKNYLLSAFKKMTQTQAWKKYLSDNVLGEGGLFGDDYVKYLNSETEKMRVLMKALGLIK